MPRRVSSGFSVVLSMLLTLSTVSSLLFASACAQTSPAPAASAAVANDLADDFADDFADGSALGSYEAHFLLRWNGARIGDAGEWVRHHGDGLRYQREERVAVRRGDDLVPMVTRIDILMDRDLSARRIAISQLVGSSETSGLATRDTPADPWRVQYGGEPAHDVPAAAMPVELVPLHLLAHQRVHNRGDRVFSGLVVLPGYGFAVAHMDVVATDARGFAVTVTGVAGAGADSDSVTPVMRADWLTTRYGSLAAIHSEHGVVATRATPSELAQPFEAPEIVDSSSIPLTAYEGAERPGRQDITLIIESVEREPPPPLPGQRVEAHGHTWHARLAAGDAFTELAPVPAPVAVAVAVGAPTPAPNEPPWSQLADDIIARRHARSPREQVAALTRATAALIDDDLGNSVIHARAALALGRGDCTTHATVFYALAQARTIPVKLVTGYRLDGDRLVRHRWAMVFIDNAWMTVDPTHGEAPARPGLLGLATHHASSAELSLIDETVFAGLIHARAHISKREF